MELIQFIFITFGITAIINKGSIFESLRSTWHNKLKNFKLWKSLHTFLYCPLCVGFWAGVVVSYLWTSPTGVIFFDATIASGTAWLLMMLEYSFTKTNGCKGCS